MEKQFFTSNQAARLTGCTPRQLQYWREKGVVVPVIDATGKGRSVYYCWSDLVALATMGYCLSVGLDFEVCQEVLKTLKEQEPEFSNPTEARRFMLWQEGTEQPMKLVKFDLEQAAASLSEGKPVIPIWLDTIYQTLVTRLKEGCDPTRIVFPGVPPVRGRGHSVANRLVQEGLELSDKNCKRSGGNERGLDDV